MTIYLHLLYSSKNKTTYIYIFWEILEHTEGQLKLAKHRFQWMFFFFSPPIACLNHWSSVYSQNLGKTPAKCGEELHSSELDPNQQNLKTSKITWRTFFWTPHPWRDSCKNLPSPVKSTSFNWNNSWNSRYFLRCGQRSRCPFPINFKGFNSSGISMIPESHWWASGL